jgi:Kdo2-lipid IVA lauroyltransferase/acyltransferase
VPAKDHSPSAWKRCRYKIEAAGLACLAGVISRLPRSVLMGLGRIIGMAGYAVLSNDRKVAYANLDIAFGDTMPRKQKTRLVRHTFVHFAQSILSLFWFPRLTKEDIERMYEVKNVELLRELESRGKGVVLVSMHFHNWELATFALGWLGVPMTIVTEPTRNPAIEQRVTALRTLSGHRPVAPRFGLIRMARTLQKGQSVGTLVDVNGRRNRGGVWLKFFGLDVFNGAAEAVMALRWGASILFVHAEPGDNGRARIVFGPEVQHVPTGDFDVDVKTLAQKCLDLCEGLIREHPEQWLWTNKRWKRRPSPEMGNYPFYSKHTPV